MARHNWFTWFTQHGSDPPFMLQYRSSDAFIIGTVSLAVFTVCAFSLSSVSVAVCVFGTDLARICFCMASSCLSFHLP